MASLDENNAFGVAIAVSSTGIAAISGNATIVDGKHLMDLTQRQQGSVGLSWIAFSNADATNLLVVTLAQPPKGVSPSGNAITIIVQPKTTTPPYPGPWKYMQAVALDPTFAPIGGSVNATVFGHYPGVVNQGG